MFTVVSNIQYIIFTLHFEAQHSHPAAALCLIKVQTFCDPSPTLQIKQPKLLKLPRRINTPSFDVGLWQTKVFLGQAFQ